MAGTIIADYIRSDANKISLNVGNTVIASINAYGILSNTGSVIIAANGVISGAGTIAKSALPSGSILQVVNSINSVESSTTSTSFTASNLSATITPTSATSKILIICNSPLYCPGDNYHIYTTIFKNGINVSSAELQLFSTGPATGGRWSNGSMTWFDTPSSTSALTYAVYFRSLTAGNASYYMTGGQRSIMTLMEIAG